MENDIRFLKNEKDKLQNVLENSTGKNYKQYATLLQAYLTVSGNLAQLESFKKQQEEREKEEAEKQRVYEEAMKEMQEEQVIEVKELVEEE